MEKRPHRIRWWKAAVLVTIGVSLAGAGAPVAGGNSIIRLPDEERVPFSAMAEALAGADIVLVGEQHDDFAHHRAQQAVITGLLARRRVVVGMETFPSRLEDSLDRWRKGKFASWPAFLEAVDWYRVWSVSPALYRPVLETVRTHRLPLVGLNVPREWISRIGREGMEGLSARQRDRIGPVAPPSPEYRESLRESLASHEGEQEPEGFIAAQTAWDAAMAGALLRAHRRHPEAVVVGLAGNGHIQGGFGIPHQIRARSEDVVVRTVVPYSPDREEAPPEAGDGDYAWALKRQAAPDPVRIGILIRENDGGGIKVDAVQDGFPADGADVREGDRILAVDGQPVSSTTALIHAVREHRWGGCLRLRLRRDGQKRTLTLPLRRPENGSASPH